HARLAGLRRVSVADVHVEALLRVRPGGELREPFHPVVAGPARYDEARRRAVERRKGLAVHLPGDDRVFERLLELEASMEWRRLARRVIGSGGVEMLGRSFHARFREQVADPGARPSGIADRA